MAADKPESGEHGPPSVVLGFEDVVRLKRIYDFRNELGDVLEQSDKGASIAF